MKLISKYQNIKNIIFDLGGVLLDIDVARTMDAFDRLAIDGVRAADIHPENAGIFLQLEVGAISTDDFIAQIQALAGDTKISPDQILDAWNAILVGFDMKRFEILDRLREHYNIYLLSNTNEPHRIKYLQMFRQTSGGRELESYFDQCFYSDLMKLRKPDVKIYRQLIAETGINPAESIFIDDNAVNFSGSEEAGIATFHLTPDRSLLDLVE